MKLIDCCGAISVNPKRAQVWTSYSRIPRKEMGNEDRIAIDFVFYL